MSLETIVEDIRDEARARAEEIRSEAEREADRIREEAQTEAEEVLAAREREVERTIEQEREQRISSANLEAKQERLEARRKILQEVREAVEREIAELETGREELTRTLLEGAAAEFDDGATVEVYGRGDDEALLADLVEEYDGFEHAGEVDCLGGVVVESDASRVRVDNTFDTVLEDVWEDEIKEISARLFEQ